MRQPAEVKKSLQRRVCIQLHQTVRSGWLRSVPHSAIPGIALARSVGDRLLHHCRTRGYGPHL